MDLIEKTVNSEHIYDGTVVDLWRDTVILPDGKEAFREVINHPGGVCVLALDENNNVLTVRQFRKATDDIMLEIPAGKLEYGEDVLEAAKRELEEETGMVAGEMISLGYFHPTPAYCREKIYMYFARDLSATAQKLDEDEFLEVLGIPFDELYQMVLNNDITDGKTVLAVLKAKEIVLSEKNNKAMEITNGKE